MVMNFFVACPRMEEQESKLVLVEQLTVVLRPGTV
jgi:hypothetical protein